MEQKTLTGFTTKIDQDQGIVEHIIAVYGNVDDGGDRLHPGSFAKTLMERGLKCRVLDQHKTDSVMRVLGKPLSIREIGRADLPEAIQTKYPDANGGVVAVTKFLLSTPEGRGAFERIKEGAIDEWSFGYDALDRDYSDEAKADGTRQTVRNLRTIKLYEYGPVLWGMNPATTTLFAKEADMNMNPNVKAPEADDALPEGKAGRRMRRDMAEMLDKMQDMIGKMRSWANYEDEEEEPEEEKPAPEKAADNSEQEGKAGPVAPPTSDAEMLQLISIEREKLSLLEV